MEQVVNKLNEILEYVRKPDFLEQYAAANKVEDMILEAIDLIAENSCPEKR